MKIIGMMPVCNEDWILDLTARAALLWCDSLVIGLHNCTDESLEIARKIKAADHSRVTILTQESGDWMEMQHRQKLLYSAGLLGATHVVTIDADELLTANLLPVIRQLIGALNPGDILQLPWLALRWKDAYLTYLTEGPFGWPEKPMEPPPLVTLAWKNDPRFYYSAADREGYEFHHRHPFVKGAKNYMNFSAPLANGSMGGLMHLQFLSERRLRAKQALYQMQEVIRWPGRAFGEEREDFRSVLAERYGRAVHGTDPDTVGSCRVPAKDWLAPYLEMGFQKLAFNPSEAETEPWQETECKRLVAMYGRSPFDGLDLFGVV